ncbi:MAG: hypothetical protein EA350_13700 [Gemmatimonadales bacterium]|nr:MAG: hypothetical protein EA350_13700 [Gemmatimonadales bacterium]
MGEEECTGEEQQAARRECEVSHARPGKAEQEAADQEEQPEIGQDEVDHGAPRPGERAPGKARKDMVPDAEDHQEHEPGQERVHVREPDEGCAGGVHGHPDAEEQADHEPGHRAPEEPPHGRAHGPTLPGRDASPSR